MEKHAHAETIRLTQTDRQTDTHTHAETIRLTQTDRQTHAETIKLT